MTSFVLVHGGFHGGWCWSRVARLLRAAGHDVFTPTLTGLADRSHLLAPGIGLSTHVDDVVGLLRWERLRDAVLCGHSYGGMVVTGAAAAEPERVSTIIYADAFVPKSGQNLLDLLGPDRASHMAANAAERGEGWRLMPPPATQYDVADEADRALIDALLTPHPYLTCTERIGAVDLAETKLRGFIHATRYSMPTFGPMAAQARADGWNVYEVACGHELMLERAAEVAGVLLGSHPSVTR